jgi:two-component system, OmpR family, sensor kinase
VRLRIAGVSAGLTFVILVCFALVVGRLTESRIRDDFRQDLVNVAAQIRDNYQLGRDPSAGITGPSLDELAMSGDAVVRIVDINGQVANLVDSQGTVVSDAQTPGAPNLGPPHAEPVDMGRFETASAPLATSLSGPSYFLQYARTTASVDATVNRLWLFLALGVVGGTALACLAGLAVAGRAMRPISALTAAAREIATTRDPSRRIPMPESRDEVAELARTLDDMLRELDASRAETQEMIQAQRDFVADASHELRTPLTSVLANLEMLEESMSETPQGGPSDEQQAVAGALGSSRRMKRLVADLLLLARADAGRAGPRRRYDLSAIARSVVDEIRPVAPEHNIVLEAAGPAWVDGDSDDLHRLVLNLAENAIRHTPAVTRIDIAVAQGDDAVDLTVSDDGPGLPGDVRPEQLFARFVRGSGPADTATESGTGLGLAIVKAVVDSHGGTIAVDQAPGGGARFRVRFPLPTPEPSDTASVHRA